MKEEADKFFYDFYAQLPARIGRYEICKNITLLAIDKILDALSEYDYVTEKVLQTEFPNFYSHNLQNMDSDFRYWYRMREIIQEEY